MSDERSTPYYPTISLGDGLRELAERAFHLGIDAAALTRDRIELVVEDFVWRGRLSREDGGAMMERLAEKSREEARKAMGGLGHALRGACGDLGVSTRGDVDDLSFRLRQLEYRVRLLENRSDGSPGGQP